MTRSQFPPDRPLLSVVTRGEPAFRLRHYLKDSGESYSCVALTVHPSGAKEGHSFKWEFHHYHEKEHDTTGYLLIEDIDECAAYNEGLPGLRAVTPRQASTISGLDVIAAVEDIKKRWSALELLVIPCGG